MGAQSWIDQEKISLLSLLYIYLIISYRLYLLETDFDHLIFFQARLPTKDLLNNIEVEDLSYQECTALQVGLYIQYRYAILRK